MLAIVLKTKGPTQRKCLPCRKGRQTHLVLGDAWSKTRKEGMRRRGERLCAPPSILGLRLGVGKVVETAQIR